jgi:hypothetical protein
MRNRLLVSAAILAAGVAISSAQHAPGAGADREAHSTGRHVKNDAAGKAAQPKRTRTTGSQQSRNGDRGDASPRPHDVRSGPLTPVRRNETRSSEPRGARERGEQRDGMASDRSILDRAMAHGRLRSEQQARSGDNRRRPVHSPRASTAPEDRGSAQDRTPNQAARRRPEPAMGRASERDLKAQPRKVEARKAETRNTESRKADTRKTDTRKILARSATRGPAPRDNNNASPPAGQADVREAQTALNQQGFDAGDADGKLGRKTKKALIAFQKQHGFQTTGKVDRTTLQMLNAGGAQDSPQGNHKKDNSTKSTKDSTSKDGSRGRGQPPAAAAPQNAPPAPSTTGQGTTGQGTTGQGTAAPAAPQPVQVETPTTPDGLQMPDASSRVPAGAPQEDYKDDLLPSGGDQR